MIKIGLSGNRYSGKNRVATLFKQIKVPVFEADVILKFILNHNYELQSEVSDRVGRIYFANGVLNLEKIKQDNKFSEIIEVVEPELYRSWEKFLKNNSKSIYCIFHSSILFEKEWNKAMDQNITVFAPFFDRVERCKYLTKKTVSSIYSLLSTEIDELEKNKLATYVIHNYNNESPFYGDALKQVNEIDKKIIDEHLKDIVVRSSSVLTPYKKSDKTTGINIVL
jgi:dephospho-CoA kinase